MSDFDDEKQAQVDGARDDAVSTAPFLLAQATPSGGAPRAAAPKSAAPPAPADPRVAPAAETLASWKDLFRRRDVAPPAQAKVADQVIDLLLHTRSGQRLVDDLHRVLFGRGSLRSHIVVDFRGKSAIPGRGDAGGMFDPPGRYAPEYTAYVAWDATERSPNDLGSYLDGIFADVTSGLLLMGDALFHELLHIWFIHQYHDTRLFGPDDDPQTGHHFFQTGTREYDSIHPEFLRRLKAMVAELEAVEAYLHPHARPDVPLP